MNKRRSKKMHHLKRKIFKITAINFVVGFIAIAYSKNFINSMIDQLVDQKYEYI